RAQPPPSPFARPALMITIDRFEEEYAVCGVNATLEVRVLRRSSLPPQAKPGDTLYFRDGAWHIDEAETAARATRIAERFDRIKRRNAL
ncbi:MAG: DUF3006 domain-containing protein, partial [Defluviitaleaceae bacterium]|nr:DUF3006 domain-containing protein [Defluviitaleaceae bacterium]